MAIFSYDSDCSSSAADTLGSRRWDEDATEPAKAEMKDSSSSFRSTSLQNGHSFLPHAAMHRLHILWPDVSPVGFQCGSGATSAVTECAA